MEAGELFVRINQKGLFKESDSDDGGHSKSLKRSQTRGNRKKSKVNGGQSSAKAVRTKSKELKQENESLKKAMNQMQERYREMLHMQEVKEKPEADEGGTRVTVGDPTTTAKGRES